uniref:interleukin-1 family member A n=1 Tax=Scatophagus argus TaxID=75038 RepID=UPI001ED7DA3A|nr:interleukin-1 family member A [Scatophagus argus]
MDLKESVVNGGVLIGHKVHEGKHQYEVENVVKIKNGSRQKTFSRGDKLRQINSIDLQDVTPEELAQILAEGNPKLTVHKVSKMKGHVGQPSPAEDTLHPVSMESAVLSFSMEMRREEDLEKDEVGQEGEGSEDVCKDEDEENGEGRDMLIVSMMKTSISVVRGRGCDDGTGCVLSDVVVVAESSTVMFVPRGCGSFRVQKPSNVVVEHVATQQYLRGLCSQGIIYASPNPEKITIYSYKSNTVDENFKGIPVVLNFTESNCFLRCCKKGEKVFLQVQTCEKQRLKQISKCDESTLSFVFYMKADRTKQRTFESALHGGWFIQIVDSDLVEMGTIDEGTKEQSFLFVIQK